MKPYQKLAIMFSLSLLCSFINEVLRRKQFNPSFKQLMFYWYPNTFFCQFYLIPEVFEFNRFCLGI